RTHREETLVWLERQVATMIDAALADALGTPSDAPLQATVQKVGNRPGGETPTGDPLVHAAAEATRLVGRVPDLAAASTDANVPMSLGIPAVTLGGGGRGGAIHTLDEWFDPIDGARGIERALLTILAVAGIHESDQERFDRMSTTESSPRST